ncbi:E3 ubiquitin protein ligase DRIP1-like isoform X2 [Diospyros lotus]|uniref:E3 ubiquitin protein ligase DRIP1-like isoform X2 n=1 Tax=Diospyros lotus TaxID=55363 RepID=UPI0022549F43|nr:E3 ubiquitin protein ligase DRIP1-like isoform X2 [Diospyros lotus]
MWIALLIKNKLGFANGSISQPSVCKECIYLKVKEGMKKCPVCQVDLSSLSPDEYRRPDENYRGLIATILGQASKTGEKKKAQSLSHGHAAHTEEKAHGNSELAEHSIQPKDVDAPASSIDE